MLDEDIAVADWFGCSEDTVSYITNSRIFLKDLLHDLRLGDDEIERLRKQFIEAFGILIHLAERAREKTYCEYYGRWGALNCDDRATIVPTDGTTMPEWPIEKWCWRCRARDFYERNKGTDRVVALEALDSLKWTTPEPREIDDWPYKAEAQAALEQD